MSKPRVLISGNICYAKEECEALFFKGVAELLPLDCKDRDDFLFALRPGGKYENVIGIYRDSTSIPIVGRYDRELIAAISTSTKYLASVGAGYDPVDVDACKEYGVMLTNTPGAVDDATATTALFLTVAALRRLSKAESDLRAGKWKTQHDASTAHDLERRTIAILGLGGIGKRFAELLRPFGVRIIYHNRRKTEDAPAYCEYFEAERFDEMLALADVLSVHVPLSESTRGLVGEAVIRKLKKGAIIVNTARGKVIDEEAMIHALQDGHLGGVGLDVFANEPEVDPRLIELPNATLLPHAACYTGDTLTKIDLRALTNLRDMVTTGTARDIVPELR